MRESISKKYRSILHPRHYIHTCVRQALSQLYGRAEGYTLDDLPDLLLERKVELCQELLKVMDIVEPGYTRLRGKLALPLYLFSQPVLQETVENLDQEFFVWEVFLTHFYSN